jgi:hypothetical protein
MPSSRSPPSGFGIVTRRTGLGRYVPCNSWSRITGHAFAGSGPLGHVQTIHAPRLCWPSPVSTLAAGSLSSAPPSAALTLCLGVSRRGRVASSLALARPASPSATACPPRSCGHLTPCVQHRHGVRTLLLVRPFAPLPAATTASADFSLRVPRRPFSHKARSPQVRTHSFTAQPPDLRHFALITRASRSLPARPARQRLLSGSCPSARSFAPRFLPTLGRPHAVALRFVRCDQLTAGLSPARVRPCRAHNPADEPIHARPPLVLVEPTR